MGGSFSSQRVAGGFLSRAENKQNNNDPTGQFDRLEIGNNSNNMSMRQQNSFGAGAAAQGGSGAGDRDWMNFASTQSASRANLTMERPQTASGGNARI